MPFFSKGTTVRSSKRNRTQTMKDPLLKQRQIFSWLLRSDANTEMAGTTLKCSISPPFHLSSSFPPCFVPSVSQRYAGAASPIPSTTPVYRISLEDSGFDSYHHTKTVLVSPTESRPSKIRRVALDTTTKPLPPTPSCTRDSLMVPTFKSSSNSSCSSTSTSSHYSVQGDTSDDGLDDLAHFLRHISYESILASTIHQHLGYVEDGGRIFTRTTSHVQMRLCPSRRYSSLMGVSVAIMEGRLPKALLF